LSPLQHGLVPALKASRDYAFTGSESTLPVRMRLHRVGARHQPSYRIVITPALTPRDGKYLDQVGFYNPVTEPATIRIDEEKAREWLRRGVQPSDRVRRLLETVNITVSGAPATQHTKRSGAEAVSAPPEAKTEAAAEPVAASESETQTDGSADVAAEGDASTAKPARSRSRATKASETVAEGENPANDGESLEEPGDTDSAAGEDTSGANVQPDSGSA
jgi:small subunit ribosomal protein S16